MAARDTLLDNFKTALEGITDANGFNTDVKQVTRGPLAFEEIQNNCPFISIIEGSEIVQVEDDVNIRFLLEVGLILYIKGYKSSGMSDSINKFISDVEKLIYAPVSLGNYGLAVGLKNDEIAVSGTENMAAATIELEVVYYATKASF